MIFIIISLLCILAAGSVNAICDTLENQVAFNASIFYRKNPEFWCKEISWNKVKTLFSYKFDAWHMLKTLWVGLALFAAPMSLLAGQYVEFSWWLLFAYLAAWNAGAEITFKLVKRKPNGDQAPK